MTIKQLEEDRQAELFTVPCIDAVHYYSYNNDDYYFIKDKRRYFLNDFLPINY